MQGPGQEAAALGNPCPGGSSCLVAQGCEDTSGLERVGCENGEGLAVLARENCKYCVSEDHRGGQGRTGLFQSEDVFPTACGKPGPVKKSV